VGWTLLAVGAITTVPIAIEIFRSQTDARSDRNTLGPVRRAYAEYVS
jgi:hypothetical protein